MKAEAKMAAPMKIEKNLNNWAFISGGSTYKSFRCVPPQQDQILLFLHMFSPKSACVGGWHPLQQGLAPPQWEILDLPLFIGEFKPNYR